MRRREASAAFNHVSRSRHVDCRRSLRPCDYLADPFRFGRQPDAEAVDPPDGDRVSAAVARLQHSLACAFRSLGDRRGAEVARRFGVSKQLWSRSINGERWMGETVMAAIVIAMREEHQKQARLGRANRT
jgi:hypothetical protein